MYTYCICPWGKLHNGTSPFLLWHNEIEDIPILIIDWHNDNNNQYLVYFFSQEIFKCLVLNISWNDNSDSTVIHQQNLYICTCIFLKIIWYKNIKTKKKGNYSYLIEEICQNFRAVSAIGVIILFTLPFHLMHQEQDIVTINHLFIFR